MKSKKVTKKSSNDLVIKGEVKPQDLAGEILTKLRQLPPSDQNLILISVVNEIAIDRFNHYNICVVERDEAGKNMDQISGLSVDRILKEQFEKLEKARNS